LFTIFWACRRQFLIYKIVSGKKKNRGTGSGLNKIVKQAGKRKAAFSDQPLTCIYSAFPCCLLNLKAAQKK
jgi:hypothetical protein